MKAVSLWNGMELPCVGYGTFPMKDELVSSLPCAVSCGCRLVDTSDNYGNESFVGQGLAACGGDARKAVAVVTKFSRPARTRDLLRLFASSEAKLGGRIDVYLLHWPFPFLWREQWRMMEDLYLSGRCRAIGVCNFDKAMLGRLLERCRVKPMVNQFERHPLFQQEETAGYCRENGIVVMSYSPFARMDGRLMRNPALERIAAAHGKSVGQVILRWNVEHGDIPIPASRSEAHIRENFDVCGFSLSPDEVAEIDALESGCRVRYDPAKRFSALDKARFMWCRAKLAMRGGRRGKVQ